MQGLTTRWVGGFFVLVMSSAILFGCQGDGASHGTSSESSGKRASSMATPAKSDGEFAAMMGMHHETAIEMARYEAQNGTRSEVREMARKIVDMQSAERSKLEAIAREEGHAEHKSDPEMEQHAKKDMASLRSARGAEVDRLFLAHMMDHHAQGVEMARSSMPNLRREDLRQMARKMIDDQTREIDQMRAMLNR